MILSFSYLIGAPNDNLKQGAIYKCHIDLASTSTSCNKLDFSKLPV